MPVQCENRHPSNKKIRTIGFADKTYRQFRLYISGFCGKIARAIRMSSMPKQHPATRTKNIVDRKFGNCDMLAAGHRPD